MVCETLATFQVVPSGYGLDEEQKPVRTVALNLSLLFVYFVELLKLCMYLHIAYVCLCVCLSDFTALNLSWDRNTLWS